MVKNINCCTNLTEAEILDLKTATGKGSIKDALQDAVDYRIMNPTKKKNYHEG